MGTPLGQAAVRGVLGAVVITGAAFFLALSQGAELRTAGIVAGGVFFTQLAIRFGAEGLIDQVAQPPVPPGPLPVPPAPASPSGPLGPGGNLH